VAGEEGRRADAVAGECARADQELVDGFTVRVEHERDLGGLCRTRVVAEQGARLREALPALEVQFADAVALAECPGP
jgi:hypothetical protein